jgi:hypothetical protein
MGTELLLQNVYAYNSTWDSDPEFLIPSTSSSASKNTNNNKSANSNATPASNATSTKNHPKQNSKPLTKTKVEPTDFIFKDDFYYSTETSLLSENAYLGNSPLIEIPQKDKGFYYSQGNDNYKIAKDVDNYEKSNRKQVENIPRSVKSKTSSDTEPQSTTLQSFIDSYFWNESEFQFQFF